jgi:hypothetical protein
MTSIEWFISQLEDKGDMRETPSIRNLQLNIDTSDYLELKRQAKEMHKQELGKTWDTALDKYEVRARNYMRAFEDFDDYYDETFKKNKL